MGIARKAQVSTRRPKTTVASPFTGWCYRHSKTSIMKIDLRRLTKEERKIYRAILTSFPATSKESAWDAAINGGPRFQFISKA